MKSVSAVLAVVFLFAGQVWAADEAVPKTQKEKVSYTIGVSMGMSVRQQALDVDPDILVKGLKDGITGAKTAMTEEEMRNVMSALQKERAEKHAIKMKEIGERNKKEGEAYLAENKKKEGVKTLSSGLQYRVIKEGTGPSPKLTDTVTTHYRGTLIDGTEFDSSYKRGQPSKFPVKGVIPGWTEALQLMKVGSKWQLFVPSNLAYGERAMSGVLGPNSTLIFEIELISIN